MTITTSPFFELERCLATWLDNSWSREQHLAHCAQGLVAEVGELIGSIDKAEFKSAEHGLRDRVAAEIGDNPILRRDCQTSMRTPDCAP